ncbi:beta-glucosidase-like [Olea europaea subsp. europaea]|uniref:Beta-glucosidase-like n=1 Tax=Olea europaea subsp. europaea TaxID=158383 RepID=A0A8S0SSH4_OLEEU|nr:beta-glucosidase-like [Olea europaea subsp. europaea]
MDSQSSWMNDGADEQDYPFGADASKFTQMKIKRSDFPSDFIFGSGASAYQVEGAWATGGKGFSNWDIFTQRTPGYIDNGSNGCVAIDQYNLWKEDVALLKKVGLSSYRFSISWTRVLPGGRLSAGISRDGIKYYNDLIDLLLSEG